MVARITPQLSINHHLSTAGITLEDINVAPVVVISWGHRTVETLVKQSRAKLSRHWPYDGRNSLYAGSISGVPFSCIRLPVGSPGTVMMMEDLIACGTKTFIALGWAGGLQSDIGLGSFLLPTSCYSEEGTSPHYIKDAREIKPSAVLVEALSEAGERLGFDLHQGAQWTTDAPYRELTSTIAHYRNLGVIGVDMETSAMYALAQFRNVDVANLLVVSDEVWGEWRPAFGTALLADANEKALQIVVECISTLSEKVDPNVSPA